MTYTYKLARRLARLRHHQALPLVILLSACAAGEPTGLSDNNPIDTDTGSPVALSPRTVTLEGTQGVLFRAFESLIPGSNQVTSIEWTATGGTIDASGSYSATGTGSFKVVGRRKGNPHNQPDTSTVIVVPTQPTLQAVEVTPSTATVDPGTQQQFSAVGLQSDGTQVQIGVTWTAAGGTIDAGGLYTAGHTAGTYRVIATHVTTGLADTAVVTVPQATLTSITLSPSSASLTPGQSVQFAVTGHMSDGTSSSSVPAAYSATGGTISVTGYYTAGTTGGTFRVIATAEGGKADTSSVTISSSGSTSSGTIKLDFESGALPSGWSLEQCVPGRVNVYSNTGTKPSGAPATARAGTYFLGMTVYNSDVYPCTPTENPRAALFKDGVFKLGTEWYKSFSIYIPNGFPVLNDFFLTEEDYGYPFGGSPPSALYIQNLGDGKNHWYLTGNYDAATRSTQRVWDGPVVTTGVWHDFVWHKRYTTDKTGWIEMWMDGKQLTFKNGQTRLTNQQTMVPNSTSARYELMQYRRVNMYSGALSIYFDEGRVGSTWESVQVP